MHLDELRDKEMTLCEREHRVRLREWKVKELESKLQGRDRSMAKREKGKMSSYASSSAGGWGGRREGTHRISKERSGGQTRASQNTVALRI